MQKRGQNEILRQNWRNKEIAPPNNCLLKECSQSVKYEIENNLLSFWFRYYDRNQSIIEIKNFVALRQIIENDYTTFSIHSLEKYFKLKMMGSHMYTAIGGWLERGGSENEIDIVAISIEKGKAVAIEVKRQKKNFNYSNFLEKSSTSKKKS